MRDDILEEYKKQQDKAKELSKESRAAIDNMYILQADLRKIEAALIQAKGIGDKVRKSLEQDLGLLNK